MYPLADDFMLPLLVVVTCSALKWDVIEYHSLLELFLVIYY